jgi:hypothetical protein
MAQLALDRTVRPERQARGDDRRDERDSPAEGSHEREQERHDEHDGTDARRYHQARAAIDTLAVAEVSALARDEIAHGTSVARPVGGQRDENNRMGAVAGAASCARSLGFLVVWLLGGALAPQSGASGEQDEPQIPTISTRSSAIWKVTSSRAASVLALTAPKPTVLTIETGYGAPTRLSGSEKLAGLARGGRPR